MKRGEWAIAFLRALGNSAPDDRTVNFVATWTLGENTNAANNPLATTQPGVSGATNFNSVGVQNFPTVEAGLQATVTTLTNGHYPHILAGLRENDPEQAINALELGTWGTGLGFTTLWRLGDHRDEDLPSIPSAGNFVPNVPSFGAGGGGGGGWDDQTVELPGNVHLNIHDMPQLPNPSAIAHNLEFIALGGLLLAIAVFLAVRTYVPVQQVVSTIEKVA